MGEDSSEEKLLRDILTIEKHEDRMITAMVQLMASSERLNRRLGVLTWIMLILTWITFIIAIPNTLATIFGIPKVSDVLGLELMTTILIVATIGALLLLVHPGFGLSVTSINKRLRTAMLESEVSVSRKAGSGQSAHLRKKKESS